VESIALLRHIKLFPVAAITHSSVFTGWSKNCTLFVRP